MAINANVLATAGTNIGQQIGRATEQFGQDIGGMLTDVGRGFSERRSSREAQQLLQQYANDPAQLNALGQKYATEGNDALSKVFFDAAKQATAKETAGQQRGVQGGLTAITQGAMRGVPLTSDKEPDLRSAVQSVLQLGGTQEQIIAAYKAGLRGGDVKSSRSGGQYKDEKGNIYELSIQRTAEGEGQSWLPITNGAPQSPVGRVVPIGGAYGETASERLERGIEAASEETKAEQFSKSQQIAVDNLPKIEVAIENAERSLELLQDIKTGGFTTAIVRSAQQFLGTEPKDQAEFNLLAGKTVLDNLSKFEGAISEGERMYLERLYQSLERSGGANQAILENLLQEAQFLLADTRVKASADSYKDYLETRPTFSSVVSRDKGAKKVNFNDLK